MSTNKQINQQTLKHIPNKKDTTEHCTRSLQEPVFFTSMCSKVKVTDFAACSQKVKINSKRFCNFLSNPMYIYDNKQTNK